MLRDILELNVDGVPVRLAYQRRVGSKAPLISLHGFGSTKEDYSDLALRPDFEDRDLISWDAPGCGASELDVREALSIPFLVELTRTACDALDVEQFHLTGHSMGGLTALMFADAYPNRVLSFFSIEGNLAPEDCFLSRQIIEHPADTPEDFLKDFQARAKDRPEFGLALYAAALPSKVRATSFEPIFTSMVALSDEEPLMDLLAALNCPRAFVYGAQNSHLSYIPTLPDIGVQAVEIDHSGHFPMYSNPPALWSALAGFLSDAEAVQ